MNSNWDQSIVQYLVVVVVNDLLLNLVLRMGRKEERYKSEFVDETSWDLGMEGKVDTVDHSLTFFGLYSSSEM